VPNDPLLSDAWLASCNEALSTLQAPDGSSHLIVTELVSEAPDGTHDSVTLIADAEGIRLVAGEHADARAWLSLSYADASLLHAGSLDPARALAEGKVRVRGDLRAVVEAAGLLAVAHGALRTR
jgi:putative sterol carrier protein